MQIKKHYYLLLILGLVLTNSGFAQEKNTAFDSTAHQFGQTITSEELQQHLQIIASDKFEGRETGKKGQKMAAGYIAGIFKSEELPPVVGDTSYFQSFPVVEVSWDDPYIEVENEKYNFLQDFYTLTDLADPSEIDFNEVIFAGYGIESDGYNDYQGLDVEGKVVMALAGEPMTEDSLYLVTGTKKPSRFSTDFNAGVRAKRQMAAAHGARALLIVDHHFEDNLRRYMLYARMPMTKLIVAEEDEPKVDVAFISPVLAKAFLGKKDLSSVKKRMARKEKPYTFRIKKDGELAFKQHVNRMTSENVLGYLEGSDLKDELIIITSHYDHIGIKDGQINNGADDDGSGTVAVLELAEAFAEAKEAGYGPRRSILFMTVSGEEKGLFGSEYYTEHPVFPLSSTVANLNIDMIGRVDAAHEEDSAYVYVIGSDRLSTELHQINETANEVYTHLDLDYTYNAADDPNRFYYRSDHYNFAKHGIPIIFYFNGVHPDYHQPTDTVEKIEFDLLAKRAKLVFYTAWQLANQDHRIEVDVTGK